MKRVLVTFAGGSYGLGITRSLKAATGQYHVIAADSDRYSLQRAEGDERYLVPPATDPGYIQSLTDLVCRTKPDVLWVGHDREIERVAHDRDKLDVAVFLSPATEIDLCNDKFESYKVWKAAGVRVPESLFVTDKKQLADAFDRFNGELWLRAVSGGGGNGAIGVSSLRKAEAWLDIWDGWGRFTGAEWIKGGARLSWESVWANGELITVQGRRQLVQGFTNLTMSGITGVPGVNQWGTPPEVDELAVAAIKAVSDSPHGNYGVDMVCDGDGTPFVTEINIGRYNNDGLIHWPDETLNAADLTVRLALGEQPSFQPPLMHPKQRDNIIIYGLPTLPIEVSESELDAT